MSTSDLFTRYSQLYQKERAREVVPQGLFLRQLVDLPHKDFDIAVFARSKGSTTPGEVYIGAPLPIDLADEDGLVNRDERTYFVRTIVPKFKGLKYLKICVAAGNSLSAPRARIEFLKKCQRIVDVTIRKARNIAHLGNFSAFGFDTRIHTLENYLSEVLGLDAVSVEAASIPFTAASPEYILLTGGEIITLSSEPLVPHGVFHFVGGIGYTFDKKEGALSEERMFRPSVDLSGEGIDQAYIESMLGRVIEDFQGNFHSMVFADLWRKSKAQPLGVNFDGSLLLKPIEGSDIWSGVFEVYIAPPK